MERKQEGGKIQFKYCVIEGEDPLNYTKENISLEYDTYYPQRKWLEATLKHELPDVFFRMFGFFDSIYAPNFVVTSEFTYHFWSLYEILHKKQKALKNHQNHDGLYSCESVVPLTLAGPDFKDAGEIPMGRNPDVLPTILQAMGRSYREDEIDGKALEDAIK